MKDNEFRAFLERVGADAVERESRRALLFDQVRELQSLGFGAVRLPASAGGDARSLEELFALLIDLARADPSLAHVYRGHFAFVETVLAEGPDSEAFATWVPRVLAGDFVGNAQSERQEFSTLSTRLERVGDEFLLTGTKYYTTGSIYADWIRLAAIDGDERVELTVSTAHAGVVSVDDWDGFGQLLTGSGTTTFDRVPVDPATIVRSNPDDPREQHHLGAIFQLVLLAVIAGIARRAVEDTVDFVRPRRRTFAIDGESSPRDDPLVQSVVGELSSVAYAARQLILSTARELDAAQADGSPDVARDALLDVFRVQQVIPPLVLGALTNLFEVGGATAVSRGAALDRHWRNVRTIASHNPIAQRGKALGQFELNGDLPGWKAPGAPKEGNP